LDLLETADHPRTTVQSPFEWIGVPDWKDDYSNAAKLSPEEIVRRKQAFDDAKTVAKQVLTGTPT
jgi:D-proline reductase (dithiol) PrdB